MRQRPETLRGRLVLAASHVNHRFWWRRAMTLGVRAVVLDNSQVFLVRHTYLPGWYLPGGAVDRGETAEAAVVRELREEGSLVATGRPLLHGIFRNGRKRDHVICYVIREFDRLPHKADWEIAETGFFPVDDLPAGTTQATRRRIDEVLRGKPTSEDW